MQKKHHISKDRPQMAQLGTWEQNFNNSCIWGGHTEGFFLQKSILVSDLGFQIDPNG